MWPGTRLVKRPGRLALLAPVVLAVACMHAEAPPESAQTEGAQADAAAPDPGPNDGPALLAAPVAESPLPPPRTVTIPVPAPRAEADFLSSPHPGQVPHVYMALQPGGAGHPVSVVFSIDAARDGTPSDDPAMRLTPEAGLCNPQQMRGFDFAAAGVTRPVVSGPEAAEGLTPADLPAYMAVAVTNAMLDGGLAAEPEETRPLNVCTRKLWERLIIAQSGG